MGQSRERPTPEGLRAALTAIADPTTGRDIVSAGLVEGIELRDGPGGATLVQVALRIAPAKGREAAREMEGVRREVEALIARQPGVANVAAVLTSHRPPDLVQRPAAKAAPRAALLLPEVRAIVAVASGKGGVGKSTVAVNLAVALAQRGLRVGLLDADIYGPSLPRMLGLTARPEVIGDRIQPLAAWGLRAMSIGFLVGDETPMIWRGPMVMGALEQMLGQVDWGPLDAMIVDMPPGTGDAQLTMAQRVALTGAVIVSTPQDLALIDARRGVRMFEKTNVPVLGLVENMSYFCCPACGARAEVFGHGGARREAAKLGASFLGEIPLLLDIRSAGDAGTPVVAAAPDGQAAGAFRALAEAVWERAEARLAAAAAPRIVIE